MVFGAIAASPQVNSIYTFVNFNAVSFPQPNKILNIVRLLSNSELNYR